MTLYRSLRMYRTLSRQLHGEKSSVYQDVWYCEFGSHHMLKLGSCKFLIMIPWSTKGLEFKSQYCQEFSLLHIIQTSSGAHPVSYPMSARGSFPRGETVGA
jgi:hypothetical protein